MLRKIRCLLQKWRNREDGSVAIEFSFLAVPFTFLLIGTIEIALMFTASSLLQAGTQEVSRMIRTGQIQQSGSTDMRADFQNELCSFVSGFIPCNGISYEVVTVSDFSAAAQLEPQYDEEGKFVPRGFDVGGPADTVLIRTTYNYPLTTPFIASALSNTQNSARSFVSTVVLEVEPYSMQQ